MDEDTFESEADLESNQFKYLIIGGVTNLTGVEKSERCDLGSQR
jgi:hypothetical protein